eukprot:GHRQ01027434.1.p1 GENE.GHRQ01027434.1~~GHRQ01027434.1.p1  ORF type:complete len:141 (+),score=19.49 GHRQ01027434.1:119-541(+)
MDVMFLCAGVLSDQGNASAHHFFMCCGPLGKFMLLGHVPDHGVEETAFLVLDAASALWQWEYNVADVPALQTQVAKAMTMMELHLPCSEMDVKLHEWHHLAAGISATGPPHALHCMNWEQQYGRMCQVSTATSKCIIHAC